MDYTAVNWLAVIVAMVASMALGFVWYMGLAGQWLAAIGKTREDIEASDPMPHIWSLVVQLVMAYFIALFTPALFGGTNLATGLLTGLHVWLGFVVTSMILNHRYQRVNWNLTLIDGGYLLGVLLLQGAVIGLFG